MEVVDSDSLKQDKMQRKGQPDDKASGRTRQSSAADLESNLTLRWTIYPKVSINVLLKQVISAKNAIRLNVRTWSA
jgi:hypothetical protein